MVGVENNGDAIDGGERSNVMGSSNSSRDTGLTLLRRILDSLACKVSAVIRVVRQSSQIRWEAIQSATYLPPWLICRMIGLRWSRAASSTATTVLEDVTCNRATVRNPENRIC